MLTLTTGPAGTDFTITLTRSAAAQIPATGSPSIPDPTSGNRSASSSIPVTRTTVTVAAEASTGESGTGISNGGTGSTAASSSQTCQKGSGATSGTASAGKRDTTPSSPAERGGCTSSASRSTAFRFLEPGSDRKRTVIFIGICKFSKYHACHPPVRANGNGSVLVLTALPLLKRGQISSQLSLLECDEIHSMYRQQ